jgi:hypothetical protein
MLRFESEMDFGGTSSEVREHGFFFLFSLARHPTTRSRPTLERNGSLDRLSKVFENNAKYA